MRHQPTVEFTCTCSHCGAANTVVEVGLPPGPKWLVLTVRKGSAPLQSCGTRYSTI